MIKTTECTVMYKSNKILERMGEARRGKAAKERHFEPQEGGEGIAS